MCINQANDWTRDIVQCPDIVEHLPMNLIFKRLLTEDFGELSIFTFKNEFVTNVYMHNVSYRNLNIPLHLHVQIM